MDPNQLRKLADEDWIYDTRDVLRRAADEIETLRKLVDRFAAAGRDVVDRACEEAEKAVEDGVSIVFLNLANLVHLVEAGRVKK